MTVANFSSFSFYYESYMLVSDCGSIEVILKNEPLYRHFLLLGTYSEKLKNVNGMKSWITEDDLTSIWYHPKDKTWVISLMGLIQIKSSETNVSNPFDVPYNEWFYKDLDQWVKTKNDSDDIIVRCLRGNIIIGY